MKNDLNYINEIICKKYHNKNDTLVDVCRELSKDLNTSYTLCWRLLRKDDFNFSRKIISAINKTFPQWDWNKVYKN
ncbi:Uncharacterised protein [Clostridium baratii]|uniref:hypothetical protein n=1 Tax=Clostridium baratii TaxID=1561 RepID=UPI0006BF5774|nr:hypothetical protein [Clostridium baratii]CUP04896.1 Uncharacterised protein [Clostridium baratii]